MLVLVRSFLLLAVLFVGACAGPGPKSGPGRVDRSRHPDFDRRLPRGLSRPRADTDARIARGASGVRADALKPSFPTLTFPNHYTLVTGLYPDHHGIVNNRMVDPASGKPFVYKDAQSIADPSWWGGEPLWVSVEKQGRHAATMFWPGSDVAIDGVRPSHWLHFDGRMSPDRRVDQLLTWFDLRGDLKPAFYTLYLEQVDHAGHDHGPDSPKSTLRCARSTAHSRGWSTGLKQRGAFAHTNIVIVSDHGMTASSADRLIYLDDVVNAADANVVTYGILAGINPKPGHTERSSMHCSRRTITCVAGASPKCRRDCTTARIRAFPPCSASPTTAG